jgi:long-chain acyl-CoA synthetase
MSSHDENLDTETIPLVAHARSLSSGGYILPHSSVGALLTSHAVRCPDTEFLIFRDTDGSRRSLTWEAVQDGAHAVAFHLRESLGLNPGARIATLTGNSVETVLIYFGAWLAGATVVPINVTEDDERIAFILNNAEVAVAFAPDEQRTRCGETRTLLPDAVLSPPPRRATLPDLDPETEALIVYTSGTTGAPKGVVLTHGNLLADAQGIARWHNFTEADRAMLVLPIHHVNGIVVTLITPLLSGGSVVLNRKFSASRFWSTVSEEACTWCSVVPTILAFLCEHASASRDANPSLGAQAPNVLPDGAGFRHFICGAGPLTTDLARRFHETFGVKVVHGYGLSETTCYSSFLPIDLSEADYSHWMWTEGFPSIGAAILENEMAIHDETGAALGPGERGEIVIRGVNVMRAYYRRPDANADAFKNGWFRSGDEGYWLPGRENTPYYFITGRLKELIIRGGVNYSPFEIDEVLAQIPGVKAGMAVGFENNFYGEEIGAYIQREPNAELTEQSVLEFCSRHLPFNKRPKVVLFGEEFPVTSTGKYQRNKLKPLFAAYKDAEFRK